MAPKRIRRGRNPGWKKPENCIIVDRTSRYGNPFKYGTDPEARARAVEDFSRWLNGSIDAYQTEREKLLASLPLLKGKDLACYCPLTDNHCHAGVLLMLANDNF